MKKSKILLFKNIFDPCENPGNQGLSLATFYLSSALRKAGFEVILSSSRISLKKNEFITNKEELACILEENPDINFVGISLWEAFFEKAIALIQFLRKKTMAFIGVGGVMPTLTPKHVLVHLPEINFLVRGNGEEIFPGLARILNRQNINSHLTDKTKKELSELNGLFFKKGKLQIFSKLEQINHLKKRIDLIDFSLLKKKDLNDGLFLFTSSGCFNHCTFCTSPYKGKFFPLSLENLIKIVNKYYLHLKEIFKGDIPCSALRIAFFDDDFLADPKRAIHFFNYLKKSPFRINFFQTGINAFYKRYKGKYIDKLNQQLFNALSRDLFDPDKEINIYIGLENLSNEELKRLGKGYDFLKAEKVIETLGKKRIRAACHFIASNQLTTLDNLLENLTKFSIFQIFYGDYFKILTPIIPYLVSFYPSLSYRLVLKNKREKFLNIRKVLLNKNHPEYDYPLIDNDIPVHEEVRKFIPVLSNLFLMEKDYCKILDQSLLNLLILKEKIFKKQKITQVIEEYKDYPGIIFKKTQVKIKNDRNNIQLIITRRCHLRCKYCPIIKRESDMSERNLYQAIDFLFTSPGKELRLDFTGGEPLLRFDLVKKGVTYARHKARKTGKKISFYLVTNLIALNEEIADFLGRENFSMELSLDGEERFHNSYKIGKDKKINPYQLTTVSLKKILSRKINHCGVMVVAPSNVKYLYLNFRHLLKLGIKEISINYALGWYWPKQKIKDFLNQIELIKQNFFPLLKRKTIRLSNLESRMEPAILNNEIMIDTNGNVHLLTDWFFEKKFKRKIAPLGGMNHFRNINEIFISDFKTLYRMFKIYPELEIKKIILNNIEIGNVVKKYFKNVSGL